MCEIGEECAVQFSTVYHGFKQWVWRKFTPENTGKWSMLKKSTTEPSDRFGRSLTLNPDVTGWLPLTVFDYLKKKVPQEVNSVQMERFQFIIENDKIRNTQLLRLNDENYF